MEVDNVPLIGRAPRSPLSSLDDDADYEPSFQQRGGARDDYSPPTQMYTPPQGQGQNGTSTLPPNSPVDNSFGSDSAGLLNRSGGLLNKSGGFGEDEDRYGHDDSVGGGFGD